MTSMKWHIALLLALLLAGCTGDEQKIKDEQDKWTVTLDRKDKRPYGSYLAYESLKYFYPSVHVSPLSASFKFDDMGGDMTYNKGKGRKLLVLSGFPFNLTEREWTELKQFISYGNEVVIFCTTLDRKIEKELKIDKRLGEYESYIYYQTAKDLANIEVLSMTRNRRRKYGYKGHSIQGYFHFLPQDTVVTQNQEDTTAGVTDSLVASTDSTDTAAAYDTDTNYSTDAVEDDYADESVAYEYPWSTPDTLGYLRDSLPNMIRFGTGEGHITLHGAPLVLSNYFLLQKGNEQYLSDIWHTLPDDINYIYWCEFYERYNNSSSSGVLWRYPATRLAMLLAIFTLLVYILFEAKRRQRVIPIIPIIRNDSVSFVETVGRLYYNKGNHSNLADKMIQQYLEWVRTVYFLNTNVLNDTFITQLSVRSGQPEATVRGLIEMIHEVRLKSVAIDDPYLYQLYNTIQQFYKNRRI